MCPRPTAKLTRSQLIKKLDAAFSQYVRRSAADKSGNVRCYTCHTIKRWQEVDAGHFQSRAKYSTRWDEQNVKPQCKYCNGFRSGEQFIFARQLDAEYGEGTAQQVERRSNDMRKWSRMELEQMLAHYKKKLRNL